MVFLMFSYHFFHIKEYFSINVLYICGIGTSVLNFLDKNIFVLEENLEVTLFGPSIYAAGK